MALVAYIFWIRRSLSRLLLPLLDILVVLSAVCRLLLFLILMIRAMMLRDNRELVITDLEPIINETLELGKLCVITVDLGLTHAAVLHLADYRHPDLILLLLLQLLELLVLVIVKAATL